MNDLFLFNNSFQDSFEINTDLFDTNIINLSIVLFVVIRFLGEALSDTLENRKQTIIDSLQNSNKKVYIVKNKLVEVKSKLELTQTEVENVYSSRFSYFKTRKQTLLEQVQSYLTQLQSLQKDSIEGQTKKVLSDVYDTTISKTFDTLYINLASAFKKSGNFSNKKKAITYSYLKRLN
ncbi:ATP synthase CF0 B chain subunit I (plastid) [Bigelowiella natans]|uniref:ATP synthase subunit b, chloroplastic n=1 Tax=Bigelowiella natans TaxID=227086 RepID=ATPF_BIGNA|nr:ATP synthase CF0 B chain subunit I [Bigelowiella natans]Q06J69.1 RecName: Full=ATP synthase subunit b, chloroplastic; AltName: Full=ATP synthase F(0) sector subunit b; AltName: Full=ATPase subunit I [Bigelowiella natans]ABG91390.1 ATP synthase CF0 B chain subunit I [Bigelowiella natans]